MIHDAMYGGDILAKIYVVRVPRDGKSDTAKIQEVEHNCNGDDDMDGVIFTLTRLSRDARKG